MERELERSLGMVQVTNVKQLLEKHYSIFSIKHSRMLNFVARRIIETGIYSGFYKNSMYEVYPSITLKFARM